MKRLLLAPLLLALTSCSNNIIIKTNIGENKSYSKVLFKKVFSKNEEKTGYVTVTKDYDSFTNKTICKIEPSKKISFSSPTGFDVGNRVNINPYHYGELSIEFEGYFETQYKFDDEPIGTIKKTSYYGTNLLDWNMPTETWSKYKKLTLRDYSEDPIVYDYLKKQGKNTEYNLVNLKKAVNIVIKCRKSIGDLEKSWKIGEKLIEVGKPCKHDPITCANLQYRWKFEKFGDE